MNLLLMKDVGLVVRWSMMLLVDDDDDDDDDDDAGRVAASF